MQFGILYNEDVHDVQITSYCSNSKTQEDITVLTCTLHEATWNAQLLWWWKYLLANGQMENGNRDGMWLELPPDPLQ